MLLHPRFIKSISLFSLSQILMLVAANLLVGDQTIRQMNPAERLGMVFVAIAAFGLMFKAVAVTLKE